ncbi:hypothetical protein NIES22_70720 (plasmid) [Calothrix brevissima NIES-22]|nr:hypothetical protein NIES22_70720 [Calothrix brevissima NIES-22]
MEHFEQPMTQKQIDKIARVVVKAIAYPFDAIMTAYDRYQTLLCNSQKAYKIHVAALIALLLISVICRLIA